MFLRVLRMMIGFTAACFGAAATLVLFVMTPGEIAGLPPDVAGDRIGKAAELAMSVAAQVALFSVPFALAAAAFGEITGRRTWTYYVIAGLAIAGLGFLAQHSTERIGQPTIVNNYALTAFMTAGFVAGLLYWIFSGRRAGTAIAARDAATPSAAATEQSGT